MTFALPGIWENIRNSVLTWRTPQDWSSIQEKRHVTALIMSTSVGAAEARGAKRQNTRGREGKGGIADFLEDFLA